MRPLSLRLKELNRLRRQIELRSFPRLQMLIIVAISGATGFLASVMLLDSGVTEMWLRYSFAMAATYLMFLFLLWLWLRTSAEDYLDFPDLSGMAPSGHSHESGQVFEAKGGEFGGGGAQGSYDGPISGPAISPEPISNMSASDGNVIGEALEGAAQAEEFAIPLIVLALLGALLFSSAIIVYSAPMLFAELLLDAALAAGLYRKLRSLPSQHWLETAIRRTAWPFIATTIFIAASGWGMQLYAPGAHSLGEVISYKKQAF
jgi:hypothetical protein